MPSFPAGLIRKLAQTSDVIPTTPRTGEAVQASPIVPQVQQQTPLSRDVSQLVEGIEPPSPGQFESRGDLGGFLRTFNPESRQDVDALTQAVVTGNRRAVEGQSRVGQPEVKRVLSAFEEEEAFRAPESALGKETVPADERGFLDIASEQISGAKSPATEFSARNAATDLQTQRLAFMKRFEEQFPGEKINQGKLSEATGQISKYLQGPLSKQLNQLVKAGQWQRTVPSFREEVGIFAQVQAIRGKLTDAPPGFVENLQTILRGRGARELADALPVERQTKLNRADPVNDFVDVLPERGINIDAGERLDEFRGPSAIHDEEILPRPTRRDPTSQASQAARSELDALVDQEPGRITQSDFGLDVTGEARVLEIGEQKVAEIEGVLEALQSKQLETTSRTPSSTRTVREAEQEQVLPIIERQQFLLDELNQAINDKSATRVESILQREGFIDG